MPVKKIRTRAKVRRDFAVRGISISAWAKANGFRRQLVHSVLCGRLKGRIGKSHNIAVLLGIKNGEVARQSQ